MYDNYTVYLSFRRTQVHKFMQEMFMSYNLICGEQAVSTTVFMPYSTGFM
ncbi:hypothetical protein EZS27_005264 [termite gut metagenome]|uniref:Uncharacterized protein n=1 Tax=termite gut metagenome TaxID=433724 RepID=A0A5J4SPC1_9ZZZZ